MSLSNIKVNNSTVIEVDNESIAGSDNLVKSGGVASFVYPEFTGYLIGELMSRIEPDSVQENSIMLYNTSIVSFNGIRVVTISVAAGELVVVDNNNGYNAAYCIFAVFDANTNDLLYKKLGGTTDFQGKYLQYKKDVIIKYSIYDTIWNNGHGIFKVTNTNLENYIKSQASKKAEDVAIHIKEIEQIQASQVGIKGVYTTNGLSTEGVLGFRYHTLYPINNVGIYYITSEFTGLAGSQDVWYAITVLDSNLNIIKGYSDLTVGVTPREYEINVDDVNAAYISVAINTPTTSSSVETISSNYYDFHSLILQYNKLRNTSYTTILSILPPRENLTPIDMTIGTPSVGIFEDSSQTAYCTSDYIELTAENYIYKPGNGMHVSYSFFRLYDADKNLLYDQKAGNWKLFQINKSVASYIRVVYFATNNTFEFYSTYKSVQRTFDDFISELGGQTTTHTVLWLGTSIPEGKATVDGQFISYPQLACQKLGWTCYNLSLGSSGIVVGTGSEYLNDRCGKDLCESSAEKAARYSETLNGPTSTEAEKQRYQQMMNWGYDKRVIPYIDGTIANCDVVVIDHSYNDRNKVAEELPNFDSASKSLILADADYNRNTYIGAFCFLLKKIYEVNPKIKVVVCSYLESQSNASTGKYGSECCQMNKKLADYFNMFYANMCDYNEFIMHLVPGTEDYLEDFNQEYGTTWTKQNYFNEQNPNGYISKWQVYCPDGVHPHTDYTGNCIKHIATNLVKILRNI